MGDFLDGEGVFDGGPIEPILPAEMDLGEHGGIPTGIEFDSSWGGNIVPFWQRYLGVISPLIITDKVAIGATGLIYDESLHVVGKIYASSGYLLGNAVSITRDGSNNLTFYDPIAGTKTLSELIAGGGGDVLKSGTPTAGQLAEWTDSTHIQGINKSSLTLTESQIINLIADLAGKAPLIHNLVDTTNHPVSGLTAGHFLKALSPTTYGFAVHGLTKTDIGLGNVTNDAQVKKVVSVTDHAIVRWNTTSGDTVQDSLMILADDGTPNIPAGRTYNINGSPHNHASIYQPADTTLDALAALDANVGFIYQTGADAFVKYTFAGTGTATSVARSDHNHDGIYVPVGGWETIYVDHIGEKTATHNVVFLDPIVSVDLLVDDIMENTLGHNILFNQPIGVDHIIEKTPNHKILFDNQVIMGGVADSSYSDLFVGHLGTITPGTVTTNGTVTLIGSSTKFKSFFKADGYETITVQGETVRTVATVVSDTELTVTVPFSTSAAGLTYTIVSHSTLYVKPSGGVGIGYSTPEAQLHIFDSTNVNSLVESNNNARFTIGCYNPSPSNQIVQRSSLGSKGSHTILTNNKYMGIFTFQGYNGSAFINAASIGVHSAIDWVPAGVKDSSMVFSIMNSAGTSITEAFRISTGAVPVSKVTGILQTDHIAEATTDHYIEFDDPIKFPTALDVRLGALGRVLYYNNDAAQRNIRFGVGAGNDSMTGVGIIAIGYYAGVVLTSGGSNTFIGYAAGSTNTDGNNNVAIGSSALNYNVSGTQNVALGANSSRYNTSTANVAIGYYAGQGTLGSSAYAYCVFIGSQAGYAVTLGHRTIAIGYQAGMEITTAADNLFIGYNAGKFLSGTSNIAIGSSAGLGATGVSSGTYNIFIGYNAGSTITTGAYNMCIGYGAGQTILSGQYNIFFGTYAGRYIDGGSHNIAYGFQALTNITDGTYNTAMGTQSFSELTLTSYNVGIGPESGRYNVGTSNLFIGPYAGRGVTGGGSTGSYNVCIGYNAGYALTTGGTNILIGYSVGAATAATNNQFRLGYSTTYLLEGDLTGGLQWVGTDYIFKTDTMNEYTLDAGVIVDGVPIKDGFISLTYISAPSADKLFTMANRQLKFQWTTPGTADGAFELEAIGAFTGDLVHIHQHTGNPGAGTHLIHLEAADADVMPLFVSAAGTYAAEFTKAIKVDTIDEYTATVGITVDGVLIKDYGVLVPITTGKYSFGDNDTYLYENADDQVFFWIGGGARYAMYTTQFAMQGGASVGYWALMYEVGSTTNPNIVPNKADLATGIGSATTSQFSLIAASTEIARMVSTGPYFITIPAKAAETKILWIDDTTGKIVKGDPPASGVTPTDNILDWDAGNSWYAPWSDAGKAAGRFYAYTTTVPTNTTALAYDGNFWATNIYAPTAIVSGSATTYTSLSQDNIMLVISSTNRFTAIPNQADGAGALVYLLDTVNNLANATSRILSVKTFGTERFYITGPGAVYMTSLASDDTEDHVLAIDDATGLITKRAVSTLGSVSITNQGNDRVVTSTATTDVLNAEANMTFSGSALIVDSTIQAYTSIAARTATTTYGFVNMVAGDSTKSGSLGIWGYNIAGAQRQGYIGGDATGINVNMEVGNFGVMHGTDQAIKTIPNGAVELYYDGTKIFETTSTSAAKISGKLGINVDPSWFLHVTGAVDADVIGIIINTSSTGYGLKIKAGGSTNYSFLVADYADADRFKVWADGHTDMGAYVGIGAAHSGTYNLYVSGTIYATGNITGNSDIRNKTILGYESNIWDKGFDKLEIIRFRYHGESDISIGYSAQNVLEYFPDCVTYDSEEDRFGLKILSMSALNTLAIQEVKSEVDILKARIVELEIEIGKLKN